MKEESSLVEAARLRLKTMVTFLTLKTTRLTTESKIVTTKMKVIEARMRRMKTNEMNWTPAK